MDLKFLYHIADMMWKPRTGESLLLFSSYVTGSFSQMSRATTKSGISNDMISGHILDLEFSLMQVIAYMLQLE